MHVGMLGACRVWQVSLCHFSALGSFCDFLGGPIISLCYRYNYMLIAMTPEPCTGCSVLRNIMATFRTASIYRCVLLLCGGFKKSRFYVGSHLLFLPAFLFLLLLFTLVYLLFLVRRLVRGRSPMNVPAIGHLAFWESPAEIVRATASLQLFWFQVNVGALCPTAILVPAKVLGGLSVSVCYALASFLASPILLASSAC